MSAKEKRIIADLLRRLAKFMADRRCLVTLLRNATNDQRVPIGWESDFRVLQDTPEYHAVVAAFEPTILQLEQGAEIEDLIPLLEKLGEGKLPN